MTLARLRDLNRHWDIFPPVHKQLARIASAFLKEEPKKTRITEKKKGSLADLMAAFGHSGGTVKT